MSTLRQKYPQWLEDNWQKCSQEDLEKYNKQMELINEICEEYEKSTDGNANQEKVFELLG
jgi:hypothetical protein